MHNPMHDALHNKPLIVSRQQRQRQVTIAQSICNNVKSIGFVWLVSMAVLIAPFKNSCIAADAVAFNTPLRYAPGVVSIIQDHRYIQTHEAPIYWKISPYYLSQPTDASCSLASATMIINALRIPQMKYANQTLATTTSVVHSAQAAWENQVKQGGHGVTLDEFGSFLSQAIKTYNIPSTTLKIVHATGDKNIAATFHQALLTGEKTGRTFIIVNFDQQVVSGAAPAGHFSPIGAYDASHKRVLIMDPDRTFFEPYWISEQQLLKSMETADSETGKNRGFLMVTLQ